MDPDETLKKIRQIVQFEIDYANYYFHQQDEIIALFNNLDEWLTKGGFKPTDWA